MSADDAATGLARAAVDWVCPQDHGALAERDGRLCSAAGEREYEVIGGVPVFASREVDRRRAEQRGPALDELLRQMRAGSVDEAADRFCRRHGCTREPFASDWKQLFVPPAEGTILELGAGFGDDSITLAEDPSRIVLAVPTLTNAGILRRRLHETVARDAAVAVLPSVEQLPLADGTVGAIALEEAALAGFGISEQNFARVAAEWKRVLRPDGVVFLGLSNPLHRLPGLASLRSRLGAPDADSMNRRVKQVQNGGGPGLLAPRIAIDEMRRRGFGAPSVYAPLPTEKAADVVLPVEDRVVSGYFLDRLVRKNSPVSRAALRAARLALKLGWLPQLVPYRYLYFKLRRAAPQPGRERS